MKILFAKSLKVFNSFIVVEASSFDIVCNISFTVHHLLIIQDVKTAVKLNEEFK